MKLLSRFNRGLKAFVASATLPALIAPSGVVMMTPIPSLELGGLGVLVDPHAESLSGGLQAPHEPRRIDERAVVLGPQSTRVDGGVDFGLHRLGIEEHGLVAEPCEQFELLMDLVEVGRWVVLAGDFDLAGALVVAVDRVPADR